MANTLSLKSKEYVLKFEREAPPEEQTKFHIRPLKWKERADLQDGMVVTEISMLGPKNGMQQGTMRHLSGTQARLAIEKGLEKIENLKGPENEDVKYEKSMASGHREMVLDSLPPEWVKEIADEILIISGLQKGEEKN